MFYELGEACSGVGLKMNFSNTKIMTNLVMSKSIYIDNPEIEWVEKYVCATR